MGKAGRPCIGDKPLKGAQRIQKYYHENKSWYNDLKHLRLLLRTGVMPANVLKDFLRSYDKAYRNKK